MKEVLATGVVYCSDPGIIKSDVTVGDERLGAERIQGWKALRRAFGYLLYCDTTTVHLSIQSSSHSATNVSSGREEWRVMPNANCSGSYDELER
jgi:hypothetical protein